VDAVETIEANVSPVVLSVIDDSDASDVDGSGEDDYHYGDKDD